MIYFIINIPKFGKLKDFKEFKVFFLRGNQISKNKSWEIQLNEASNLFHAEFGFCIGGRDHAGLTLILGLVGYEIEFNLIDNRHWDYGNNCWEEYEQD